MSWLRDLATRTSLLESPALLALALLLLTVVGSWAAGWVVRRLLRARQRSESAAKVFGQLTRWSVVALGLGAVLTVLFPSIKPVNILGGLGVISIAAGIAFQTVLGNFFAGIVILSQDRIRVGDQIEIKDVRGNVTRITLGHTTLRTFDGRRVLIPNSTMHSEVLTVQTGYETVRSTVHLMLDDDTDPLFARQVALEAAAAVPLTQVGDEPQALLTHVEPGCIGLDVRFWSGSRNLETLEARSAVISAVLEAFAESGVKLARNAHLIEVDPETVAELRR